LVGKTYKVKDALKSGFITLRPALYLVMFPDAVSKASSPPTAKPSLPTTPAASTIGDGVRPTLPVMAA
jgi:hypothetical protein